MGKNAKLYKRATRKEKEKLKIAKNSFGGDNSALELKMKKMEEARRKKQERKNKTKEGASSTANTEATMNDDIMNDGPLTPFQKMQQQRKMTSVEKHEQKYPRLEGRVDYVDLMYKKKTYKPAPKIIN